MRAEEVLRALTASLGAQLRSYELRPREVGVRRKWTVEEVWAEVEREALPKAVAALKALGPLHISVISGHDAGETIELLYHLAVGFGTEGGEVVVTLRTFLPKSDPTAPSLCAVLPGAEITEREKIEFLGVDFLGIPRRDHVFLPDGFPVHPWRRDEPELARFLHRMVEWEKGHERKEPQG
ncbi:MAG: NADH-quinone oxidoreductase subunit C [Candidatus Bipolaricaulota bacterium]|nr:NADH-quinone oxidoreductase subunit C [Candidatus Bipolaricaulota bacterium]MCX7844110.1 NADH-quinone oxidoreductase subunit C [Candidatus Bipolaricaulota bacterium]MDW8152302.1 NADH-quinone oxidoreductase subunit C [Candidatus Bipolaricaulota bacterium]